MEETTIEETKENPVEEETTEEKPQIEEKETPKEETKDQYTDREKRYYARMKSAEEAATKAKQEAKLAKEEAAKSKMPISDVDAIVEVQTATKDLDTNEIAELKLRATATGKSLSEARKDENYLIWLTGFRERLAKEKQVPPPSSPSGVFVKEEPEKAIKEGKVAEVVAKKVAELEAKEGKGEGI